MAATVICRLVFLASIFSSSLYVHGWDEGDFEIFDAVEEVNQNFYEFLEVSPDASSKEIRKAYRKLTLKHHPDKNKEAEAETTFRKLVSVYEILKDEDKRKRYDKVLVEGLPDWKQPIFYYRRVRKMGLGELFILLVGIGSIGHFLTNWAVYFEKKLVVQDVFESKRKKELKKLKKAKSEGDVDDILQEEINAIPRPKLTDLWPVLLVKFIYRLIITSPQNTLLFVEYIKEILQEKLKKVEESEEENEDDELFEKRPRKKPELPEYNAELYETGCAVSYLPTLTPTANSTDEISVKKSGWTEDDTILLAKLVNKFPGGTPQRWTKIAELMERSVEEVTSRSKKAKVSYVANLSTVNQVDSVKLKGGNISKKGSEISDNIITKGENGLTSSQNDTDESHNIDTKDILDKKRHKSTNPDKIVQRTKVINEYKNVAESKSSDETKLKITESDTWTQNQQMIFEWALRQYPKGTEQRWEKIAEHLPGKSKEDCIIRFKHLAELVKKKKAS